MIETVTIGDFRDRFQSVRPDNFTYEGLGALFDYFESMETEEYQITLDVIGICCEFSEYDDLDDFIEQYGGSNDGEGEEEFTIEQIPSTVIEIPGGSRFIVQDY